MSPANQTEIYRYWDQQPTVVVKPNVELMTGIEFYVFSPSELLANQFNNTTWFQVH